MVLPINLASLHDGEEELRSKAIKLIAGDHRLRLHLDAIEAAMDLADTMRQARTADEDSKVIQVLGMRMFNALAASLKLALSGYNQNSALIIRDILETVFLLSYFHGKRSDIARWRLADRKLRMKEFSPVKIREALDARDGNTEKKRAAMYELFSELAGHPTMMSAEMLRPTRGGDAVIGPFVEATSLDAVLSELGRLAVQVGEVLARFVPADFEKGVGVALRFAATKSAWFDEFYPGWAERAKAS